MNKKNYKTNLGFTLIELLVSLTLFSIVVVVALGALLSVAAYLNASRAERRVVDNLNFAIESMSRTVAYGKDFTPYKFPDGTDELDFKGLYLGVPDKDISFFMRKDSNNRGYIARVIAGGDPVQLTDDSVNITDLTFYVSDTAIGIQPLITVIIHGESYASKNPQEFNIQTSISQRDLNLPPIIP